MCLQVAIQVAMCLQVAICAGCNAMHPWGAFVTGTIAGLVYLAASWSIVKMRLPSGCQSYCHMFTGCHLFTGCHMCWL